MSLSKRYDLTIDERDMLGDILDSEAWPVLVKAIEVETRDLEQAVVLYTLSGNELNQREFLLVKARAEGARNLLRRIVAMKKSV